MKKLYFRILFYLAVILAVPATAMLCSRTVTVMGEAGKACAVFLIDAGHGGVDGGAVSCTGKPESHYNLEIALRLRDVLGLLGYETQMVRTTDISVYTEGETIARKKVSDLKARVAMANAGENTILLSIHQNTFSDSRYRGPQVFWAGTEGSRELAAALQETLNTTLFPDSRRSSAKAKGVYLMEHIRCTGALIECGFLSNPGEEALLRDAMYQKQLSCAIATAAVGYLQSSEYPNT